MLHENKGFKSALVVFKSKPAKIINFLDKKIEIQTLDDKKIKLPPKNVQLLVESQVDFDLNKLEQLEVNDLELTWELLQEQDKTTIEELCELFFESVDVNEAYTVWLLALKGEYFSLNDDFSINIHSLEQRKAISLEKLKKQKKEQELNQFIERLRQEKYFPKDEKFLKEIVSLATLKSTSCRFFKYLNMEESESNAYKLLLDIGYLDEFYNPYLHRYKAELASNPIEFKYDLKSDDQRVDLTYLDAYAIDDEGSNDPDDAISWDFKNNKMWVHIADPSSSIKFDGKVDLEARARGSNLYVPEKIVSMLPLEATKRLGLGLNEISPALSIGFQVSKSGDIENTELCFSKIKVIRLSYENAEKNVYDLELGEVANYAKSFTNKRLLNNAVELDFPEVRVHLYGDKNVKISNLVKLSSRTLVRDTMLMAGVAVGQFCISNNIPVPFSIQPDHEFDVNNLKKASTLADMFATRKKLQRGGYSTQPEKHAGMGLSAYVQVTSPLRRYLDLVVHYQIRKFLNGEELIPVQLLNDIIAQADLPIRANRQTERSSNMHWKLVYLLQNPNMKFRGTVIEKLDKNKVIVSIEALAMTKKLVVNENYDLNDALTLLNTSVNLVNQEAFFKVLEAN